MRLNLKKLLLVEELELFCRIQQELTLDSLVISA